MGVRGKRPVPNIVPVSDITTDSKIEKIIIIMKYAKRKKIESLILLIDFRKDFDSLLHKYINECMKIFNFGPSIRKWVSLFFSNREAYILLGGELTKRILLEQGVHQGDVVSPYIFILTVELLLIKIKTRMTKVNYKLRV